MTSTVQPGPVATESAPSRTAPAQGRRGRDRRAKPAHWSVKLVVVIICFFWIVPAFGTLITSFRTESDANTTGWWTALNPANWGSFTLSNYHDAIVNAGLGNGLINSFAIALPATFIPILIAAFAAYAFTFMRFPGRDALFLVIVSLLVVPNFVAMVPLLQFYGRIGRGGVGGACSRWVGGSPVRKRAGMIPFIFLRFFVRGLTAGSVKG